MEIHSFIEKTMNLLSIEREEELKESQKLRV